MSYVYCAVAKDALILAQHTARTGTFREVAQELLKKLQHDTGRKDKASYLAGEHTFHLLRVDDVDYLCLATSSVTSRAAFALLQKVAEEFKRRFGDVGALPLHKSSMEDAFLPYLRQLMEFYSETESDKLGQVSDALDNVKLSVRQNIDKVLGRGEKLDMLVDQTELLTENSRQFRMTSRALHREMWLRNLKTTLVLGCLVLCLVIVLAMWSCGGPSFSGCKANG